MIKRQFTIAMNTGFARPATLLVKLANKFESKIFLEHHKKTVYLKYSTKSIIDIISLGIKSGTIIYIKVNGPDEVLAIKSIEDFLKREGLIND